MPPGHIPVMNEDAVMVEFTQDTTYTNAEVQAKMKDRVPPATHRRLSCVALGVHASTAPRRVPRRQWRATPRGSRLMDDAFQRRLGSGFFGRGFGAGSATAAPRATATTRPKCFVRLSLPTTPSMCGRRSRARTAPSTRPAIEKRASGDCTANSPTSRTISRGRSNFDEEPEGGGVARVIRGIARGRASREPAIVPSAKKRRTRPRAIVALRSIPDLRGGPSSSASTSQRRRAARRGGRLRRRDDGQDLVRGVALVQQLVGVRHDGVGRARQHERRRQPQRRALAPQVVEAELPRRVRLSRLAVQVQVGVRSGHGPRAVEGARPRRGGPSADAADGHVGAYWRSRHRRIGGASSSSSRSMAQTLSSSSETLSESPLSSSPLSDTMKLSWGCWGECAMLPQRCWRSAAGSVWVRVVSALASCASEVALLDGGLSNWGAALLHPAGPRHRLRFRPPKLRPAGPQSLPGSA